MKAREIMALISKYGGHTTFNEWFEAQGRPYRCVNCEGKGSVCETITTPYPSGFPDSGWVPPTEKQIVTMCALCEGHGWTRDQYKPKFEQTGWDIKCD